MEISLLHFYGRDPELFLSGLDPSARKDKDSFNRLRHYLRWLEANQRSWLLPVLKDYVEYLKNETRLSPMSTKIHLSTIRSRYRALLERQDLDSHLTHILSSIFDESDIPVATGIIHAYINDAVDVSKTVVAAESKDVEYLRLTAHQAVELLQKPTLQTLVG